MNLINFRPYFSHKTVAVWLLALLVFFGVLAIFIQSIKNAPPMPLTVSPKGLSKLQLAQLNELLEQQDRPSYFSANLREVQKQALTLSWVQEASVTRDWHKGLIVRVSPRQPIARFGSERLVDIKGEVFSPANTDNVSRYPLATIQGEPEQVPLIMARMQQVNRWYAPLGIKVADIILTPRMTWLIRFNSGLRVLVDSEDTEQKLLSVSQVLQNQLKDKRDDIESIDMRYKNGFAIAWKNGKKPS